MVTIFNIHPVNPQERLIKQAVEALRQGAVMAFPTDSAYALGCRLDNKVGLDKIRQIRKLSEKHHFTVMCRDLSDIGTYAQLGNTAYRLIKEHTPGPYTFILEASSEVPRRLHHPQRRTVGVRISEHPIVMALVAGLGEPLLSVSALMPGETEPLLDAVVIEERLGHQLDFIIDGGLCTEGFTTVIDFEQSPPKIIRAGRGDTRPFEV